MPAISVSSPGRHQHAKESGRQRSQVAAAQTRRQNTDRDEAEQVVAFIEKQGMLRH